MDEVRRQKAEILGAMWAWCHVDAKHRAVGAARLVSSGGAPSMYCISARGPGARHVVGSFSETYGGNLYRTLGFGEGKGGKKEVKGHCRKEEGVLGG